MRKRLLEFNKYLIAAIVLAIPLYPKFPLFRVPNTYVSVRLEDFLIALTLLTFFVVYYKKIKKMIGDRIFIAIAVFLLAGFASYLSGVFVTQTVDWKMGLFHLLRRAEYISMFGAGYLVIKNNRKNLQFFLKLIPLVIVIAFLYGAGQKYLNWPIVITQNEEYAKGVALRYIEGSHINSTFAGHYDLATYLVFFLPLMLLLAISSKKMNIYYFIVYFCGMWLLVNTASRISLVSFLCAAMLGIILLRQYKKGIIILFISLLFIGFSSNLINRYERVFTIIKSSFFSHLRISVLTVLAEEPYVTRREIVTIPSPTPIPVFEDRSTSIRLNVEWPRAVRAFSKNPLLGTGYSSITLATDNDYLRLLGEIGILGFLSFFLIFAQLTLPILGYIKKGLVRGDVENVFIASFVGGFAGILINAVFIDVFEASKFAITFWLFTGMVYGEINYRITVDRST